MGLNYNLVGDNDEASDLLAESISDYPRSTDRPIQFFLLVTISLQENEEEDAQQYLALLKEGVSQ